MFLRQSLSAFLAILLISLFAPNVLGASSSPQVGITVNSDYNSLIPGQGAWIHIAISNTPATGLKSAQITLSYDENVFTTNGYHYLSDDYSDSNQYTISAPYTTDKDPSDGKQEVVFTVSAKDGKYIKASEQEEIISVAFRAKDVTTINRSIISIVTDETILKDSNGGLISNYTSIPAKISISNPISMDIVQGTLDSTISPFKIPVDGGNELNARAYFENGDISYVTESATWESSDTSVITIPVYGTIKAVGVGTASIIVTLGTVTSKHKVTVLAKSETDQSTETFVTMNNSKISKSNNVLVKIIVNGELVDYGLIFEGNTYVPLKAVSDSLGLTAGYDKIKKVPTIGGKSVMQSKSTSAGISYITATELESLLGATVSWDKINMRLCITK